MDANVAAHLQQALQLHRDGRLDEAEQRYRQVLQLSPDNADAHYYLAVAAYQRDKFADAAAMARQAIARDPRQSRAHRLLGQALSRLGRRAEALASLDRAVETAPEMAAAHGARADALMDMGRLAEALEGYDRALALDPESLGDWCSRAAVLERLARYDEAMASYDRAIALRPDFADAHFNRGIVLTQAKRYEEALASYERCLECQPDNAAAFNNRGLVLNRLKRHEDALANYDQGLRLHPDHANLLSNRGVTLRVLERFEDALASYDRALTLDPGQPETICNRGNVLVDLRRFEEAVAAYDKVLGVHADSSDALYGRGNALAGLRRLEDALAAYDRALALRADRVDALNAKGFTLHMLSRFEEALESYDRALALQPNHAAALHYRGIALERLKRFDDAVASYEKALASEPDHAYAPGRLLFLAMRTCDWARTAKFAPELERLIAQKSLIDPLALLACSDDPALHRRCAETFVDSEVNARVQAFSHDRRPRHEKIRVAYLSANFYRHATSYLIAELFALHDRTRFEVIGISFGPDDGSDLRARLVESFDQFHDVRSNSDRDIATLLNALEIDIAVDLMGHIEDTRPQALAYRPAPIQVNYLGYPGTVGASFFDYVIADRIVLPLDQQRFYAERIVQLPDCYQVNDSKRAIAPGRFSRRDAGLPDDAFVFCSFNNSFKITPLIFDAWMRLLAAVEGSVLWLIRDSGDAETNLRAAAASRGIDPARLVFAGRVLMEDHLARHRLADLFLDTLPYNAHTTASDALWAGLPLVTCRGNAFAGRVAASLLHAVGLPELVTGTLDEYEALALQLARDPARLRQVREKLERNRRTHPLFDADRFRRHIEAAYLEMWRRHQQGEPPAPIVVEPVDR